MLAFESLIAEAGRRAGMLVPPPELLDQEKKDLGWSPEEYPHFAVFCTLQLSRPMNPGEHWENAKIIARIPEDKIKKMTLQDFLARGLIFQT